MPKRSAEEKIDYYRSKLKELQPHKRHRRVIVLSESSDSETNSDHEEIINEDTQAAEEADRTVDEAETAPEPAPAAEPASAPVPASAPAPAALAPAPAPPLDAALLAALGAAADDAPAYGDPIHPDLAQRWLPILRKGLPKEAKENLLKEYSIPENCKLLRAPSLNAEISAAITDAARGRDKKIEASQQQLGVGVSAVNRAMTLLLTSDDKDTKVRAVKILSDGCRILADLHHVESQARIKLVTPGLDKAFTAVMQDLERDETLFSTKLSDKIKASKAIEKQGLQIKKGVVVSQKSAAAGPSSGSAAAPPPPPRRQGNWSAPARAAPSRPRRSGLRSATRRAPPARTAGNRTPAPRQ